MERDLNLSVTLLKKNRRYFKSQLLNLATCVQLDHVTCLSQVCLEISHKYPKCTSEREKHQ